MVVFLSVPQKTQALNCIQGRKEREIKRRSGEKSRGNIARGIGDQQELPAFSLTGINVPVFLFRRTKSFVSLIPYDI